LAEPVPPIRNPTPEIHRMTAAARDDPFESRLQALEERLMFYQRQVDELSEVVLGQRREVDQLRRELAQCRSQLERIESSGGGDDLPHEKPPHY
jgi:uncharacterized coiled-coil protein SlyX